jgi:hypothetical protein
MNRFFYWFVVSIVLAAWSSFHAAEEGKVTLWVQLVRGNNDAPPPAKDAKPIGPKLATRFRAVFRWDHYWEIKRVEVSLAPGQTTRVRLSAEREVEIAMTREGKRIVTAYEDKKPVASVTRPVGEGMTICGGERDPKSSWFLVVRRDKPTTD